MVMPGRPPDEDDRVSDGKMGSELRRQGTPSMSRSARNMREALQPTAGCPACALIGVWGHGMKHSAACRVRRSEYERALHDDAGLKRGHDETEQMRKRIKQEMVEGTLSKGAVGKRGSGSAGELVRKVPRTEVQADASSSVEARTSTEEAHEAEADMDMAVETLMTDEAVQECLELNEVMCDVTGECIPDESAKQWAAEELKKLDGLGTFVRLTETEAGQYRRIPT
eukprot:4142804-Amphidinium_carterae.1